MATSVTPVPTLSTMGWVRDAVGKMDFLLSHFFLSDYNQTYLYRGHVTSLPRIIEKNGSDVKGLLEDLERSLFAYLGAYYDSVEVSATEGVNPIESPSNKLDVVLTLGVSEAGVQGRYTRLLQASGSKMQNILTLNNG